MGDSKKKIRKYKAGDKYYWLCIEEKLPIASNNNPKEFFNERSNILNVYCHKNAWLLGI